MSDDTLRASFLAEAIPNFRLRRKYLPPRPLPLTKSHISRTVSDDTLRASFLAEAIPNFRLRRKYLPPRPLPLTKSHISPLSAFLSKLKPSLLACSAAASSPVTLLHAARPPLSRQVIHTRPPSSSFHIPHAPTAGTSATPSTQITDPSTK